MTGGGASGGSDHRTDQLMMRNEKREMKGVNSGRTEGAGSEAEQEKMVMKKLRTDGGGKKLILVEGDQSLGL